jgi:hypothetical protein
MVGIGERGRPTAEALAHGAIEPGREMVASGAGGRQPSALCGRTALSWIRQASIGAPALSPSCRRYRG